MTPPTVPPAAAAPVHLNLIAAAIVHLNLVAAGAAAGAAAANQLNATSPVSTNDVAFCFFMSDLLTQIELI